MFIKDIENYKKLSEEINKIKKGESNNKIEDIIEKMKSCVDFNEKSEKEKLNEKIENIIEIISNKYEEKTGGMASETFTEGLCYYFAIMLKKVVEKVLNESCQIYVTVSNSIHAIVKIHDNFYDINGNINNKYDRFGYLRNEINIKEYHTCEEEEFLYFIDLCNIRSYKKEITKEENVCDVITEEIIKELKY